MSRNLGLSLFPGTCVLPAIPFVNQQIARLVIGFMFAIALVPFGRLSEDLRGAPRVQSGEAACAPGISPCLHLPNGTGTVCACLSSQRSGEGLSRPFLRSGPACAR